MELFRLNYHLKGSKRILEVKELISLFLFLSCLPGDDEFDDFPESPGEWHVAIIVIY